MLLRKLRCVHFKNHSAVELAFAEQLNFIVGPNGAGKTSLLDAVYYLSCTKSAFNSIDTQNIQHGQASFAVEGQFVKEEKPYALKCVLKQPGGKVLTSNGKPYERLSDHIGLFPVVLTTPYDMDLIRGGSEVRRKFFDGMLCQLDRAYLNALLQYQHLLKQRNSLLRRQKDTGHVDKDLLASYDSRLLPLNKQLFEARAAFIDTFIPRFQKHYQHFVAAEERVKLTYVSELAAPDFEQRFYDSLAQDLVLQRTTKGVHRDDIQFALQGHPLKKVGSQGQQKSFVIALRLAQYECLHEGLKLQPLLLLDDIFDKLDEQRIDRLVQLIAQQQFGQVFITDAKGQSSTAIMQQIQAAKTLITLD
ncbi:MAG: DNA replication and repair protein RecF [Bacteroidota bacterium]